MFLYVLPSQQKCSYFGRYSSDDPYRPLSSQDGQLPPDAAPESYRSLSNGDLSSEQTSPPEVTCCFRFSFWPWPIRLPLSVSSSEPELLRSISVSLQLYKLCRPTICYVPMFHLIQLDSRAYLRQTIFTCHLTSTDVHRTV